MLRSRFFTFSGALLIVVGLSLYAVADDNITKTFSEPLGDVKAAEVQIELGLAEIDVAPGPKDELASISAQFNPEYTEPVLDVERDGDNAYIMIEAKEIKKRRGLASKDVDDEYSITLNPDIPIQLRAEFGVCETDVDLSGMTIERLVLESGVSETDVVLSAPNQTRARLVRIETGVSEFNSEGFGYLHFDRLEFDGGVGASVLDFQGYQGDGIVEISVGLGDLNIIIPDNVGVRLYYEKSFLASVDLKRFDRVGNDSYESEDYDKKEHHLEIDLEVGLGAVDFKWK